MESELLSRLRALEADFQRELEAAKLEALKEFAYGAGHEINNPLANISARAQTLLATERDPERRRMLASINAQAFRAHEMIADMMLFARPPAIKATPFDARELVTTLHQELAHELAARHIEFSLNLPDRPAPLEADRTQIAVAVRSLLNNALEAIGDRGRLRLSLLAASDHTVQITVEDDGPGIPAEIRGRMFDPYFSGREAGRGLGLGLSKCWRIVTDHGGRIEVDGPAEGGARLTVILPAVRPR